MREEGGEGEAALEGDAPLFVFIFKADQVRMVEAIE